MEQLRISGKHLGELSMKDFCPRCFWIKIHCKNLPFQIFPGIFSSIDSYSKKITNRHFEKNKVVPDWINSIGEIESIVKVPSLNKFFVDDEETQIHLTGVPDEMFQLKNKSYVILDYKTARYTGNQDELLPMYEVQLNSYAYIAERIGLKPISWLGLLYYEPM